jgi:hypothetical protein
VGKRVCKSLFAIFNIKDETNPNNYYLCLKCNVTIIFIIKCQTSNIPFVATMTGKQGPGSWEALWKETKPLNVAAALLFSGLWILRKVR